MFIALFVFMTLSLYEYWPRRGTNMPTIILKTLLQYFSEFLATTVVFNCEFNRKKPIFHIKSNWRTMLKFIQLEFRKSTCKLLHSKRNDGSKEEKKLDYKVRHILTEWVKWLIELKSHKQTPNISEMFLNLT